ncbi:MAG TPA: family 10 glycosylhydrolase [Candidatus Stackebrandtia excrementipullorum]|nr:family 10 glycosylhydrolase [Candidatus Stackebrandtia excrementipullorum]
MKRRLAAAWLATIGLLGTMVAATPAAAHDETDQQWRSLWVDAFNEGIYNPEQVSTLVEEATDLNANALIVQVARRYDCFCNRALYPRTDAAIDPAPYDPLDEVIEQAHAAGIEVHAWVNVNTMWNSATAPTSPDHVYNQHGPDATGSDRWLNKMVDGTEMVGNNTYIDPGHPDASAYIVNGISSILSEYDVDGINLDYVRYPDGSSTQTHSDWGYNDVAVERFLELTGRTETPAPDDAQWSDWRRDQVTNLVRKIYLTMYEINPMARLSHDGITYAYGPQTMGSWEETRPYAEVLQDWKGWLDEGIIDTTVAMNYKRNWMDDQAQMFDEWNEVLADWQGERQSVSGPALYLNDIGDTLDQVESVFTPTDAGNTMAGWSGYSYAVTSLDANEDSTLRDSERQKVIETLTTGEDAPFAEPADVPEMTWKTNPTEGHVVGYVGLRTGAALDQVTLTLEPVLGRGSSVERLSDGNGWFGFANIDPGLYFVTVTMPDDVVGIPLTVVNVKAGGVNTVDFGSLIPLP